MSHHTLRVAFGPWPAAVVLLLTAALLPAAEAEVETTCRAAAAVLAGASSEQEVSLSRERSPVGESVYRWQARNGAEGRCRAVDGHVVELTMTTSAEASEAYAVTCESSDRHRRECEMKVPGTVRIDRQLSRAACDQGRTWGVWADSIWVDDGCRAVFEVRPFGATAVPAFTVTCESNRQRRNECALREAGSVHLDKQLSRTECIEGRTWGLTDDGIWVDDGCRAVFAVFPYGAGGGRLHGPDEPKAPTDIPDRSAEAEAACRLSVESTGKVVIAVMPPTPDGQGRVWRVVIQAAHLGRLREVECRWDATTGRAELD